MIFNPQVIELFSLLSLNPNFVITDIDVEFLYGDIWP